MRPCGNWNTSTFCFWMPFGTNLHPTHSTVKNSMKIVERLKPKRAVSPTSVTI